MIGLPRGLANCSDGNVNPLATTVSSGYNFSDDASCGFTGPTDKQNGGNPLLGALGANGGLTQTRVPDPRQPAHRQDPDPGLQRQ